ncbi:hypothetical protein [Mesorhizobium sp. M7A.F.Ca.MR.362.00.0.0]|uniref:hypothetical protein n=1 Tax=Mesorhizobium sp. M7A.F.Ca.MR.362.00.0.0 TaxID=2496779 RepID=UPI000FD435E4|nr:hypothetical protein [Mesorhizobium sp. M7A.F.Ca.MR.362.00.0.0]RUU79029.1 hypothetical protein EOC06_17655 [Mesorhizobium sp. M7A.F.Ca.MR.362.00.0.0]RWN95117.1 MAG: hypothetical protein EOS05_09960 [Mesorhizobium sp.]
MSTRWIIRNTGNGMFASVSDRRAGVKGYHVNSYQARVFDSLGDASSRCAPDERPFPYFIPRTCAAMRRGV